MTPELRLLFIGIAAVFIVLIGLVLAAIFKRDDATARAHKDAEALLNGASSDYYTRRRISAAQFNQEKS